MLKVAPASAKAVLMQDAHKKQALFRSDSSFPRTEQCPLYQLRRLTYQSEAGENPPQQVVRGKFPGDFLKFCCARRNSSASSSPAQAPTVALYLAANAPLPVPAPVGATARQEAAFHVGVKAHALFEWLRSTSTPSPVLADRRINACRSLHLFPAFRR